MFKKIIQNAINHPKQIVFLVFVLFVLGLTQFPGIKVDTDPENMLPYDHPARAFDREVKKEFGLSPYVIVGFINEVNPLGVYNKKSLNRIYKITNEILDLDGVVASQVMALSTRDNIEQEAMGALRFQWFMDKPLETDEEAQKILKAAQDHPFFSDSIVSFNGKALCLYVALKEKGISYEVAEQIKKIIAKYPGDDECHFAGIPVAEDQFGVEMFSQMAISVPLSGLVIFLLMRWFFQSSFLVIAPMLMAMATVVITMGTLIALGYPVHIMSSMIPIFLMPIAVLDSIHILSEFFDKYSEFHDRKKTILSVIDELFNPMLFTSLTSAAGFFSLSFSPIPPVQVFGVFVAGGILLAWLLTITFIPAYIMLMNKKVFTKFGYSVGKDKPGVMDSVLGVVRNICLKKYRGVLVSTILLVVISIYGITLIIVNDNPVEWFSYNHPIRVADRVLNKHFSGTYEAYLVFEAKDKEKEIFKEPKMLRYLETFQEYAEQRKILGSTTSLVDLVKKIYDELLGGDKKHYAIPDSKEAVSQCIFSFESSHYPDDLWHLITPDYSKLNMWFRLQSGQNKDMLKVMEDIDQYFIDNPPPFEMTYKWAGLSYLNVVWQQNMVSGMQKNFLGSYIIVLFMMLILFRSPVKALISMIPLTVTILFIYSLLGFSGKYYDMPVAVLSALTLGLSIDFSIHFIQRALEVNDKHHHWEKTAIEMFGGPGRAILRNAMVVAIGFLPLLFAPLVPYKTVGFFMFSIMAVSSLATLFILPSLVSLSPQAFFEKREGRVICRYRDTILIAVFIAVAVAYLLMGYSHTGWENSTTISLLIILVVAICCFFVSKMGQCKKGGSE